MMQIDSRKVKEGDIFYAIGDGIKYIESALLNGANKVYTEIKNIDDDRVILVTNIKDKLQEDLKKEYGYIFDKIKLIGITGTNGKTTSAYLLYSALNKLGIKSSYIGTIGYYVNDEINILNNTTPDVISLYNMLLDSYNKGSEYICMEVSSHALDQDRVMGLPFFIGIFSNLSVDHLDYHKTLEEYANCKSKLFDKIDINGYAVINGDDDYKKYMLKSKNNNVVYGTKDADYLIGDINIINNRSEFKIDNADNTIMINTSLLGNYNAYNITTVTICLKKIGLSNDEISEVIKVLQAPPGRMDTINYGSNIIIIDYAHTPDAVEKVISCAKEFTKGNIYTLIGCGGDRDSTKRLPMAKISTDESKYAIFTEDNPRTENPFVIFRNMIGSLNNINYIILSDRKRAIQYGIDLLNENDTLLILGKGHENYQVIGKIKNHFDDKEECINYLKLKNKSL